MSWGCGMERGVSGGCISGVLSCPDLHSLGFHMLQPLSWWVASSLHSAFCLLHPSFHRRQECPPSDLFTHALSLILPFIHPSLFTLIFTLASFHHNVLFSISLALTLLPSPSFLQFPRHLPCQQQQLPPLQRQPRPFAKNISPSKKACP